MVAHQDARHGRATPRDRNRPREASSAVTAGKTRHSPQRAESRKRGNGRLSLHSERVPTCPTSLRPSYSASSVINTGAGPKRPRARLDLTGAHPDIELRRPAPHGTAFTRMNGGDTCRHLRQLWSRRATVGKRSTSPISTKP